MLIKNMVSPVFYAVVVLALAMLGVMLVPGATEFVDATAWLRAGLNNGEYWRIITGHFVHLNSAHAAMNGLALAGLGLAFGDMLKLRQWATISVVLCLAIGLMLLWRNDELSRYVGFSGVLHGLFAVIAIRGMTTETPWFALALLGLLVKVGMEQRPEFDSDHLSDWIGATVIVDAHLYGALGGVVIGCGIYLCSLAKRD